jgi:hypothetical protein
MIASINGTKKLSLNSMRSRILTTLLGIASYLDQGGILAGRSYRQVCMQHAKKGSFGSGCLAR